MEIYETNTTQLNTENKNLKVIAYGITEKEGENVEDTVCDLLKQVECRFGCTVVTKTYRPGEKDQLEPSRKKTKPVDKKRKEQMRKRLQIKFE